MQRNRTIAAAPVRTASEAWRAAVTLIADTLERSDSIAVGSVSSELAALDGLGAALVAGGHLQADDLFLVDEGLHFTILVVTADAALDVQENLNPVPGGTSATSGWMLYLPDVEPLAAALSAATARSSHLSLETPPSPAKAKQSASVVNALDPDALRRMNNS